MCQVFAILFRPLALITHEIVAKNTTEGRRVLIVTYLLSSGIIKARLQDDLTGLVLTFNEEGLAASRLCDLNIKNRVGFESLPAVFLTGSPTRSDTPVQLN